MNFRKKLYILVEDPVPKGFWTRSVRLFLQLIILLNIFSVVFESVDQLSRDYVIPFYVFECASVALQSETSRSVTTRRWCRLLECPSVRGDTVEEDLFDRRTAVTNRISSSSHSPSSSMCRWNSIAADSNVEIA